MPAMDRRLFTLIPNNNDARNIVRLNPKFVVRADGEDCLAFNAGHQSTYYGSIVTFGHARDNDVILDQHYPKDLCCFSLTSSGELLLEDLSKHDTSLSVMSGGEWGTIYKLPKSGTRSRIIPRDSSLVIHIMMSMRAKFLMVWDITDESYRVELQKFAARNPPRKGRRMVANLPDPLLTPSAYEEITNYTPSVQQNLDGEEVEGGQTAVEDIHGILIKDVHTYAQVGQGRHANVFRSVDLRTGEIWAVKTYAVPPHKRIGNEAWKTDFQQEVENLNAARHPNILRIEHHQGWMPGAPVELFTKLYSGNVAELLPDRSLTHPHYLRPESFYVWTHDFVSHVLSGLSHMHAHRIMHRDIRPENILYRTDAASPARLHFVIAGFGLAERYTGVREKPRGALCYMAPEGTQGGQATPKSDVYSFGVALLEVLGVFCLDEGDCQAFPLKDWRQKLASYGARRAHAYRDVLREDTTNPTTAVSHARIHSLLEHQLVHPSVALCLRYDPAERGTARAALRQLRTYLGPPGLWPAAPRVTFAPAASDTGPAVSKILASGSSRTSSWSSASTVKGPSSRKPLSRPSSYSSSDSGDSDSGAPPVRPPPRRKSYRSDTDRLLDKLERWRTNLSRFT